ncbi:hypothetical protein VaNZ11_015434, partial [Volvox africanus]
YARATKRQSYHFKCKYGPGGMVSESDPRVSIFIGETLFFALIRPRCDVAPVKVAVCNLHRAEVLRPKELYRVKDYSRRDATVNEVRQEILLNYFPKEVGMIDSKVIRCRVNNELSYFLTYVTFSQLPTNDGGEYA